MQDVRVGQVYRNRFTGRVCRVTEADSSEGLYRLQDVAAEDWALWVTDAGMKEIWEVAPEERIVSRCDCGADAARGYRPGPHSGWCSAVR